MSADVDTGFEQGSMAAANAILAFLNRIGEADVAARVLAAWNDGTITDPDHQPPHVAATLVPSKMSREEAKGQGFTGDACDHCGSMKMQVAGHCTVCAECGTTTGCS